VRGRRILTEEGVESNFAVGNLSRYVLTTRLLGLLSSSTRPSSQSRIVVIGGVAQNGKIFYDDMNLTANFSTLRAVTQFCEANDVFVIEQARRLAQTGTSSRVTINELKVGVVRTSI